MRSSTVDRVRLATQRRAPFDSVLRRVGAASALVLFVAVVVFAGRDGYIDVTGEQIGFLDAVYYASVTVTTTGYGDITAVSDATRLATVLLITPARILVLILVVGTTVEVLTDQSRQLLLARRWRRNVDDHIVICGFGATGQSAANELLSRGVKPGEVVAVDLSERVIAEATEAGFVGVVGDATENAVLAQAAVDRARAVVVTPNRDDTAVLITLSVREQNPRVHIVVGGREQENLHLLRQGGADEVIDATASVGRMLGLAVQAPAAVHVVSDIVDAGTGLELVEIAPEMADGAPRVPDGSTLVSVQRGGRRLGPAELVDLELRADDRLVVLRDSSTER